jgi:hypothetical protein
MKKPEEFEGSKLKIARGRRHATEFNAEFASYLQSGSCAVFLEIHVETGEPRIALRIRQPAPRELSAIFGDAVHNFRTALDILANDLVALSGVQPKKVYFPFSKNAAGFEAELKAKMGQATDSIKDIVRSFKPYAGGNELLRAMHDLDIGDKHIAIVQIGYAGLTGSLPVKKIGARALPGGGGRLTFALDPDAVETTPIDMTGFSTEPHYRTVGKMVGSEINFIIAPGFPLTGHPVVEVLNKMGDLAQSIVKTFEAHCFG